MFNIHQYIDDVDDGIKKEAQVEKEARHDGIATTALVVDKNIQHNSYRTGFNSYELTLYSLKETFHKQVSKKEFDAISTNTYIQVVVKDDRILLGNKEDEEETIRYLSSKE